MTRHPLTGPTLQAVLARLAGLPSRQAPAGAALFSNAGRDRGELLHHASAPDPLVALDAVAAWLARQATDGADKLAWTSGALCEDSVLRCRRMGVPVLLFDGDATEAGLVTAARTGLTAIGHRRGRHQVFTGQERFQQSPPIGLA